ncbi:MAG: MFS transporter [Acidimicrobiales bacterium]|nr:MFS transporter [Acidimicrobiales bacterium]
MTDEGLTAPDGPRRSRVFRSLRHRNARLYFLGLVVSNVGTWLQATALAWLVLGLTGSGTALGIVTALQFLPMLLFGAWGGAIADRVDRRRLLYLTQSLAAAQAIVLGAAVLGGWVTIGLVYALAAALGLINAVDTPVRRSFIGDLVEHDELANAMSLNTAVMTGSRIAGPALAGLLIDVVGTGWCFVANGVSFAALLLALAAIDRTAVHPVPPVGDARGQVLAGLRYVRSHPVLRLTMLTLLVVSTFTFNYQVTLPLLVDRVFGGGAGAFGALLAIISAGSLVGSFVTAARPDATVRFMLGSLAVLGVFLGLLALAPTLPVAMALGVPMGAGGAAFVACTSGLLVANTAPQLRGRVLALQSIAFLGSTPIGGPVVGWIGEEAGARWALAVGAIVALGTLVVAALAARTGLRPDRAAAHEEISGVPQA